MPTIDGNTRAEKTTGQRPCLSSGKTFSLISIFAILPIISPFILMHLSSHETNAGAAVSNPMPVGQLSNWDLIFSDEFNGSSLDTSKRIPGWFGSHITQPAIESPSGQAMPVGDLPGWKQIFAEDFTVDAPLGSWGTSDPDSIVYIGSKGGRWSVYPDAWPDTAARNESAPSRHMPSEVVSVQGGLLNKHLHSSGDGAHVAALVPQLPGGESCLYGRFTVRFRTDSLEGYKAAWLLWPESEVWPRDGEIDFPEGPLDGDISAFMHRQDATSSDDQDVFRTPTQFADGWHTATIEWTEDKVDFILNGEVIGTSTSRIPNSPMRWVLQTETCVGNCQPAPATQGNLQIDWVVAYEPITAMSANSINR